MTSFVPKVMGDDVAVHTGEPQQPPQPPHQPPHQPHQPPPPPQQPPQAPSLMNNSMNMKVEGKEGAGRDDVCRDYQRGVCQRGDKCKFYHPADIEPPSQDRLPICRDFQNAKCNRSNCKYMHITTKDERIYMRTGKLPADLDGQVGHHNAPPPPMAPAGGNSPGKTRAGPGDPVCKDFLNNVCDRGSRCKFRHVFEEDWQYEKTHGQPPPESFARKRRRESFSSNLDQQFLQEENDMLRRKVADMQRQIGDLRAMNDTLYEQNMRYRSQLRNTMALSNGSASDPVAYPGHGRDASVTYPTSMGTTSTTANSGMQSFSSDTYGNSAGAYDGYTKFQ